MNPVTITCWAAFILIVISTAMMIRGESIQSDFHRYVSIGISCISALLLFIACLLHNS